MENHDHIELTAAEISTLRTAYQNDTMAVSDLKHFLIHIEDKEIKELLEEILSTIYTHIERLTDFFHKEDYPVPQGFTEQEVILEAPRIFSDKLYLEYALKMTTMSMATYSIGVAVVTREDVADYFRENLVIAKELYRKAKKLSLEKRTFIRPLSLPKPNQVDCVKKQSFLAGWFADLSPLLGTEITNLVFNAKRNAVGQVVIIGFSQLAKLKEIRKYFERGRDIAGKYAEIFSSILHEVNLHEGSLLETFEVTDSSKSSFSDKLKLFMVTTSIASGMGQYGTSMSVSPRRDLVAHFTRLIGEIPTYADDGANIMIENGWMEQPPMAADRKGLAK